MQQLPVKEYFSIREIAQKLCVDYQVIRVLIIDGYLKATKVGKQWRISQVDFDRYIDTHSTQLISNF